MILKYILSFAFLLAGGAKLLKAKPMVQQFKEFGLSSYMVMVIGLLEVIGAIGLQISNLSIYATIGLILLMIGAMVNHLKVKHKISLLTPSLVLLVLLLSYLYIITK